MKTILNAEFVEKIEPAAQNRNFETVCQIHEVCMGQFWFREFQLGQMVEKLEKEERGPSQIRKHLVGSC